MKNKKLFHKKNAKLYLIILTLLLVDISASFIFFSLVTQDTEIFTDNLTDAAIVLFGGFNDKNGMNTETMRRVNHTLNLYNKHFFQNIICSGGARHNKNLFGAELMKNKFIEYGVPEDIIFFEIQSNDTISNLNEALKIAAAHKWKGVTIITSPLHIYRVKKILSGQDKNISISFSAYPYAVSKPQITLPALWAHIHYEWASYALFAILPEHLYDTTINFLRQ